jgi:hypothetical protein
MSLNLVILFSGQYDLSMQAIGAAEYFKATALSDEAIKQRAAFIEKLMKGLPEKGLVHDIDVLWISLDNYAAQNPVTPERAAALCVGITEPMRNEQAKAGAAIHAVITKVLEARKAPAAPPQAFAIPTTARFMHTGSVQQAPTFKSLHNLRGSFAAVLDMWRGTTLCTPKDGAPSEVVEVGKFVTMMLFKGGTPSFSDTDKERGVEALRQALLSNREILPMFHNQQYSANAIITNSVAMRESVGQHTTLLALAVLATMYWLSNERVWTESSIPAAVAIEHLITEFDSIAAGSLAAAWKQEDLYNVEVSKEVRSFISSVKDPKPRNMGWDGISWSQAVESAKRARKEEPSSMPPPGSLSVQPAMQWPMPGMMPPRNPVVSFPRISQSPQPYPVGSAVPDDNTPGCARCNVAHLPANCWVKHPELRHAQVSRGRGRGRGGRGGSRGGGSGGNNQGQVRSMPPPPTPQL